MGNNNIPYDKLSLVKLAKFHNLLNFDCAELQEQKDLNEFLKDDALKYQELCLATTYLCIFQNQIVGYVTICSDCVKITQDECSNFKQGLTLSEIPAMKIARLAVDKNYKNRGIGKYLILMSLIKARQMMEIAGVRVVTVDAKKDSFPYYKKRGFKELEKYKKKIHPCLYIDIYKAEMI